MSFFFCNETSDLQRRWGGYHNATIESAVFCCLAAAGLLFGGLMVGGMVFGIAAMVLKHTPPAWFSLAALLLVPVGVPAAFFSWGWWLHRREVRRMMTSPWAQRGP
jgi:hypothetical protein